MTDFLPELWLEQLKFLPGNEVYRCKLISKKWKDFIEKCEASLPKPTNFPSSLNPEDKYETIGVSDDKMRAAYLAPTDAYEYVGSVRSDFPIPLVHGLYYFEAKVIDAGESGFIGVGISRKAFNLNNQPGWRRFSFGYHGDDGKFFDQNGWGRRFGPLFTTGDTIGCGFELVNRSIFYTKNGEMLGVAKLAMNIFADWYPTIGLHSPGEVVEINFGQRPFLYDINQKMKELHGIPLPSVDDEPADSSDSSSSLWSLSSDDDDDMPSDQGNDEGEESMSEVDGSSSNDDEDQENLNIVINIDA